MIAKNSSRKELLYLLAIYFVFLCLIPLINGITATKSGFYICTYTIYPLYFFLGYAIREKLIEIKTRLSLTLIISGAALIVLSSYYAYRSNVPALKSLLNSYAFLPVLMQSLGLFSLIDGLPCRDGKLLSFLDANSFGVYLIHMIFLKYIFLALKLDLMAIGGVPMIIAASLAVYVVSTVCTSVLRYLPFVKKIL